MKLPPPRRLAWWTAPLVVVIVGTVVVASAATLGNIQSADITNATVPDERCTTDAIQVQPLRNLSSAVHDYGQVRLIDVPAPCVGGTVQVTAYDASGNALGDGTGTALGGITSIDIDDFDRSLYAGAALTIDGWGLETDDYQLTVAVGNSRLIWYSTDGGDSWQNASVGGSGTANVLDVATDGAGNWVAVGANANNRVWYSTDGINWTTPAGATGKPTQNLNGVATDGFGRWVAVGAATSAFYVTYDGSNPAPTWTAATISSSSGSPAVNRVATDGGGVSALWVAAGDRNGGGANSNAVWRSSDRGVTWTASAGNDRPAGNVNDVASNGAGLWAVPGANTNPGPVWVSANAISWSGATPRPVQAKTSIATDGEGLWVTAGSGNNDDNKIWYSATVTGATSWTQVPDISDNAFRDVATDDRGRWIAIGNGFAWRALTASIDSWSAITAPGNAQAVAFDQLLPN